MQRYANRSGHSGVVAYELGADSITVKFTGGDRYLYDVGSTGADHIARMRELAREGHGLSTYISQHVRERYARKLD
jgi:hypothetical protein